MQNQKTLSLITVAILVCGVSACGGKKVRRIDPESTTDLSGYWNDTDSRIVANEMIQDALSHLWIQKHQRKTGEDPVVIVGLIRNRSEEHIATGTFTRDLERAYINSGQVRVVASSGEREELREERFEQQDWANEETRKKLRDETGADYMLSGTIEVIIDREGGTEVKFYQIDLNLTDIESNERVWIGQAKIKKEITRSGLGL